MFSFMPNWVCYRYVFYSTCDFKSRFYFWIVSFEMRSFWISEFISYKAVSYWPRTFISIGWFENPLFWLWTAGAKACCRFKGGTFSTFLGCCCLLAEMLGFGECCTRGRGWAGSPSRDGFCFYPLFWNEPWNYFGLLLLIGWPVTNFYKFVSSGIYCCWIWGWLVLR